MTFLTELERLKGAATNGPWIPDSDRYPSPLRSASVKDQDAYVEHEKDRPGVPIIYNSSFISDEDLSLIVFLRNHADALAGLVRAAEEMSRYPIRISNMDALRDALAKLNGAEK